MEEFNSSYVKNVAQNHNSRLINIQEKINSMQSYALIKNEKRTHIQLSIYYLIKNQYHVVTKKDNRNTTYQIKDLERQSILSSVHKNSPALKALFNDYNYTVGVSVLFRLCIALCLSFEESYDWFRVCGYELNSSLKQWQNISNLLIFYTKNSESNLYIIHNKLINASNDSISNGGPSLYPKKKED